MTQMPGPSQRRATSEAEEDERLAHIGDVLFPALARFKPTEHVKSSWASAVALLPRRTKALGTNLMKDVMSIQEPLLLVITGHLYLDYILYRMIKRCGGRGALQRDDSFSRRLKYVESQGWLSSDHIAAMTELNKLRNRFAHDIFYDFATWDPSVIPYYARCIWHKSRRRHLLIALNMAVARLTFVSLLIEVTCQHRWLHLEDVQGIPTKRNARRLTFR